MMGHRRTILTAGGALAASGIMGRARAQATPTLKLGILGDLTGPYRDLSGLGTMACVRQAIDDLARAGTSVQVEVVHADHQHRADVGSALARQWFDQGVDAILEVNNSAIALAVADLAREKDKVFLATGPATADLHGPRCGPNHVHWTYDTWMLANGAGSATVRAGGDSWYFLTADYAFGHALQRDTARAVEAAGGRVLGQARYPFPATTDYSSFLLQAQASRAKVLGLANAGTDTVNCVKQAHEFGLTRRMKMVGLLCLLGDVRAMGAEAAQGLLTTEPFYWDLNDRTRGFTQRVLPRMPTGIYPSTNHAGAYSAVTHYLKAAAAMGTAQAKVSGRATIERMKAMPTDDDCLGAGRVREDGRKIHPVYLFEVKAPAEVRTGWDLYKLAGTIEAEQAMRPLSEGGCPMVRG
ncbi:ABC transporter substrate-binding protein [Roseococcus sp.]|uniref:ABC transporter substrate-binding protein n=1 Tax=Roseococcus sp. TaxID=2109646 RepID=UPI003BAA7D28